MDASIIIDVRKFNASMLKSRSFGSVMTRFDGSNPAGVFQIKFKHQFFYYFTDQERQVEYPRPLNGAWKERVLEVAANVLAIPSTRARPACSSQQLILSRTAISVDKVLQSLVLMEMNNNLQINGRG